MRRLHWMDTMGYPPGEVSVKKRDPMSQKQRFALSQAATAKADKRRAEQDQSIYMAVQFTTGEAGMVDVPLRGAHHLRVRIGREVLDLQVEEGGLRVRSTTGGVLSKGTCHNEVIVYPCDHQHRRTT